MLPTFGKAVHIFVDDILDEAIEITGIPVGPKLYKKITRVIEVLSKKGNWDAGLVWINLNVQQGNILIMPREVETPIKININGHPAFSRDKLYEFSLNGPGSDSRGFVGWQWMDQNRTPISVELPETGSQLVIQGDAADNGKVIQFWGIDSTGAEVNDRIVLDGTEQTTAYSYATVRRVKKDITTKPVVVTTPEGDAVANYYPNEKNPTYRKVKLSKPAAQVRAFCRLTTITVTGPDDFIPLDSGMAITSMLRAHEVSSTSQTGPSDESEAWEKKAMQYLTEDQAVRSSAMEMSKTDEVQSAFNLNVNNRDSVIVADVLDDASDIFGNIGKEKLFDRIGDAVSVLNNKSLAWEGSDGYVDLNVGTGGLVTLPRYCHRPIMMNQGNRHLEFRNKWFEMHLNSPEHGMQSIRHWDDRGNVVTINDPPTPFRLVAINDLDVDDGATLHIYGIGADGKPLRSRNPDLTSRQKWIDGIILTANQSNGIPSGDDVRIKRITRIIRDETNSFQQLVAYDDDNNPITVGYYYPDETEPQYSRIQVPCACPWIRMRYRKRDLRIRSLCDPLHLKSRVAIVNMMNALKAQRADPSAAEAWEKKAVEYLKDYEASSTPPGTIVMQFDKRTDMADPLQGRY